MTTQWSVRSGCARATYIRSPAPAPLVSCPLLPPLILSLPPSLPSPSSSPPRPLAPSPHPLPSHDSHHLCPSGSFISAHSARLLPPSYLRLPHCDVVLPRHRFLLSRNRNYTRCTVVAEQIGGGLRVIDELNSMFFFIIVLLVCV